MKLIQAKWADFAEGQLKSIEGKQPLQMQHSDGTALPLVLDDSTPNKFGADIIRFPAGKGVGLHTHVGSHILMVTKGTGILVYSEERHEMFPGMIYLVPSNIPHAIKATTELVLIAVGNDHRPADSSERLDVVQKKEEVK
jgi:quercetin dioxygenase-like cupin family protein